MSIGKTIGSKLSVQSFGWNKAAIQKAVIENQESPVFLMRAVGVVSGLRPYKDKETGETKFGSLGSFEITAPSGETQNGTTLYLPSYVQALIDAAFQNSDVASIRIAFDIYAEYNERSATSYSFTVNDLLNEGNESVDSVKSAVAALPLPSSVSSAAITDQTSKTK